MSFTVTVLGSNSAIPAYGRHPSSQLLNINNEFYLIDCGEGTQMQLSLYGLKRSKINYIFISHLHGDHFFGLIGLITSLNLLKRSNPLYIFAHPDLKKIINIQLELSYTKLCFDLIFMDILPESKTIFSNKDITVNTFAMSHRIATTGFVFRENNHLRKIIKEQIDKYKVPVEWIRKIKEGEDFIDAQGTKIANALLTSNPQTPRSYAYASDTCYLESIIPHISNVNLLYHEATFKTFETERAAQTFHSTTVQAATIAQLANVKQLMIGHYSAKYKNEQLEELLLESQSVFANTLLAIEGNTYEIEN